MFGRENPKKKLWKLIRDVKCAMLTTSNEDGALVSRPMATQKAEFDGSLWFFTSQATPKALQIRYNQHVNVSYSNPNKHRYVSVSGRAELVEDRQKMHELWHPGLKAWFPKGLDDPEIALVRVDVDTAEYWDSSNTPVSFAFGLLKAVATGRRARPGRNRTLEFVPSLRRAS